jgi:hypothetical protein
MRSKLIYNERLKHFAAFFNNLGIACFVAAGLAPLIAAQSTLDLTYVTTLPIGIFLMICCVALSQIVLGSLQE